MANRWMNQFSLSFVKKKVAVYARVTFGAAGAPTLDAVNSQGIASISRTSAGLYVITFQDVYVRWLQVSRTYKNATAPAAPGFFVVSDTIGTTTKTLTVQFANSAGAATDPASGEEVRFEFKFNDSTAF